MSRASPSAVTHAAAVVFIVSIVWIASREPDAPPLEVRTLAASEPKSGGEASRVEHLKARPATVVTDEHVQVPRRARSELEAETGKRPGPGSSSTDDTSGIDDAEPNAVGKDGTPVRLTGKWGKMEVRDAATMTEEEFYREYVVKGIPVIIRNDHDAVKLSKDWNVERLTRECGDMEPNFGIRVLSFLDTLSPELYADFDKRLLHVSGGEVGLERLKKAMRGEDGFRTLREYLKSSHFSGSVATNQASDDKDWMHPSDYLLPVSVHSIPVSYCDALMDDVLKDIELESRWSWAKSLEQPLSSSTLRKKDQMKDYYEPSFFMFVGPDKSRAYNPHRHGVPNYTLMLQVTGFKHAVVWPNDETPNLYPVGNLLPKSNELGEVPAIYQVDAFSADFDKQPDLARIKTSWEGIAKPGDLMFIPCGLPHAVQNRDDSVALGWFTTDIIMREGPERHDGACPNRNGVRYDCKRADGFAEYSGKKFMMTKSICTTS